jgi:zinc and cadmium transporter
LSTLAIIRISVQREKLRCIQEFDIASFVLILLATLFVGTASVLLAAFLSFRLLAHRVERMVSFSIGILLATTFLHLLPEAFGSRQRTDTLFLLMFAGILTFFFLEKIALYRHSHHFEGDGHHHKPGHDARQAGHGGALVLVGSAFHNFSDGVLIAGAFLAGPWLGLTATLSIFTHEIPHKISDFIVLLHAGVARPRATLYAGTSSLCILAGGLTGYFLLQGMAAAIPFVLVIAASSFIYISLSDLVPRMQKGTGLADAGWQAALIALGISVVVVLHYFADR